MLLSVLDPTPLSSSEATLRPWLERAIVSFEQRTEPESSSGELRRTTKENN